MKLNIYDKNEVVKTFECENYDLKFGVVEDVIELFDFEDLKSSSDIELIKIVGRVIPKSLGSIKDLMKDIFNGLTDKDLKNTTIKELAGVLIEVVKYALNQISEGINQKK